ncbi:ABC transporter ATP-binding protein [Synechococcus sp. CS-1328]|nr:ABC transporter ATP-binding protein [Synechococcus sp. CS-1328]
MVQLRAITKTYQMGGESVEILHGIDLTILRGDYTAIVGSSGSGQSTLMTIMGCLEKPSGGHYYFDARDVTLLNDNELTDIRNFRIGFIFQQFNLLSRLTALENVMLPLVYAGAPRSERRERAEEMLAQVGLADRLAHRPNQLSGGQQQRVAMARALVNQPELLLADEPTGALDSRTGQEVIELISSLHAQGLTIVLVTHDPAVAHRSGRIVRLQDGQITGQSPALIDGAQARVLCRYAAPKGPTVSTMSTRMTSISGPSAMVGIR